MDMTVTLPASRLTVIRRPLSGVSAIAEPRNWPTAVVVQAVGPPELVLLELLVLAVVPPIPLLELAVVPPIPLLVLELELVVVPLELELVVVPPPMCPELAFELPPPQPPATADAAQITAPSPKALIGNDLMQVSFCRKEQGTVGDACTSTRLQGAF
jgi:hypothetical protein